MQQDAPKVDKRGHHWKAKVGTDKAAKPSKGNQQWAESITHKYAKFCEVLEVEKPELPWQIPGARLGGNQRKWLYYHLLICERKGAIELKRVPDITDANSFYGITEIHILDMDTFDSDEFPFPRAHEHAQEKKHKWTVIKNWRIQGFETLKLTGDKNVVRFSKALLDRMETQRKNIDTKRRGCRENTSADAKPSEDIPTAVAVPVTTPMSGFDALVTVALQQQSLGFLAHKDWTPTKDGK